MAAEIREVQFDDLYGQLRNGEFDVQLTEFPAKETDLGKSTAPLRRGRSTSCRAARPVRTFAHAAVEVGRAEFAIQA